MTLPNTVSECMREREYVIATRSSKSGFLMSIMDRFDPKKGNPVISTFKYDKRTGHIVLEDSYRLDRRLYNYIIETLVGLDGANPSVYFHAFEELSRMVHF